MRYYFIEYPTNYQWYNSKLLKPFSINTIILPYFIRDYQKPRNNTPSTFSMELNQHPRKKKKEDILKSSFRASSLEIARQSSEIYGRETTDCQAEVNKTKDWKKGTVECVCVRWLGW